MKHCPKKIRKHPSDHIRMDCPPQTEGKVTTVVWKLTRTPLLIPTTPTRPQRKLKEKDIVQ